MISEDNALRQSMMTADEYLANAKRTIDKEFGAGFAASNSSLVAAYMAVCAADLASAYKQNESKGLVSALNSIAASIRERG